MNHLSRILVAVDFPDPARFAFEQALAIARAHGAAVSVVHAVPADQTFQSRARARRVLIGSLRQMAEASGVRFSASVQQGDPSAVILLHARARRPDLIVLGTRQRTGMERLRAGSIAERVALDAAQPVLVVPARDRKPAVGGFDRIAVAMDLAPGSYRLIERALALAGHSDARMTVVHVVPGSPHVPRRLYRYGAVEYQTLLMQDARHRLARLVPREAAAAARIHARVVAGDPAAEIERIAGEIGADLIVAGVTRRGVIARTVFGTTVGRVMRTAVQPVLVVPAVARAAGAVAA